MASKLGALDVEAFDIDEWSIINARENIENNQCVNIRLRHGTISELKPVGSFDIILANINKYVLLEELRIYSSFLERGGQLLISGFYEQDRRDIATEASHHSLCEEMNDARDNWASLLLRQT